MTRTEQISKKIRGPLKHRIWARTAAMFTKIPRFLQSLEANAGIIHQLDHDNSQILSKPFGHSSKMPYMSARF
jgi:hypothetical protein